MARQVPSVPANIDNPTLRNFLSAVREALNTAVADIASGNISAANAAITADALSAVSGNLANLLDTSTPPQPTGLTVTGIFTTNFLHWDLPSYANYNFAEIWRISAVDGTGNLIPVGSVSLANAVLIGTSNGNIYTDPVDAGAKYYYWIRFISGANVAGPYNAVDGTLGATSESVNDVLTNNNWKIAVENLIAVTAWIRNADILNGAITNAKISGAIYSDNYNGNVGFYLDKSGGNVNLNQLTVRDTAGNIILQSSAGGIDWSKVLNKTGFASISQLDASNISTYMANAAIGNAQMGNAAIQTANIGDAAVQTLKIAGNAVTIPISSSMTVVNPIYLDGGGSNLLTITLPSLPDITKWSLTFGYTSGSNADPNNGTWPEVAMLLSSTNSFYPNGSNLYAQPVNAGAYANTCCAAIVYTQPANTSTTLNLFGWIIAGSGVAYVTAAFITAVACKR